MEYDEEEVKKSKAELQEMGAFNNTKFLNNSYKDGMLSAPTRIFYDISYYCPETCDHCYTDSSSSGGDGELSLSEKYRIVDQMVDT